MATDSLDVHVNGVRVFCRGAVWTPGDLAVLDAAVELGLNLVRVSGITGYETDAFHTRCDELGLLVWQDLMLATFDYPLADEGFVARLHTEVTAQAGRLRGHPSTVVGLRLGRARAAGGDVRRPAGMPGAPRELAALARPWVEATGSTSSGSTAPRPGGTRRSGSTPGSRSTSGWVPTAATCPTCGTRGCGSPRSAWPSRTCPTSRIGSNRGPRGVPGDNGADWDFADVREHYLRRRYGADPTPDQARRVTGEVMAEVFGEWRRPGSGCGGGIVLWLRDLEPGAGWGLLDQGGRTKACARVLAPTLQPTAVWLVDEGLNGLDVHVAHEPAGPVEVRLRVELLREDGSVLESAEDAWTMAGRSHRVVGVEQLLGRFADVSYAYRFGPASHTGVRAELSGDFGVRTATWSLPRSALDSPVR